MPKHFWLLKSEPDVYSFADLQRDKRTRWDGVRNYQARNFLRDQMKVGDGVLFYHSNAEPPGVFGTAKVIREGYPDPTQFDRKSGHYDGDSKADNPRWYVIDVAPDQALPKPVTLPALRATASLKNMVLLKRGRLSVQPVTEKEWGTILHMGGL